MKALSLWQPWASLLFTDLKRIETRCWPTRHRGPLWIHAAKRPCESFDTVLADDLAISVFGDDWRVTLPRGCLLGVVDLVDCVPTEGLEPAYPEDLFGNFMPGRFGWVTRDPILLEKPISWRGAQGLFDVAPSALTPTPTLPPQGGGGLFGPW